MPPSTEDILSQALAMPENERAAIAERLLLSLDTRLDPNVEEAWQQEVQRRLSEIENGDIACVPWEEVRRRIAEC